MEENFSKFFGAKSKFVYYNDLQRTYPNIYQKLKDDEKIVLGNHSAKLTHIASTMRGWASAEAIKEVQLLREYFNVNKLNISPDQMYTSTIGREITEAMNESMQLKEVYERHITRILGPEGRGKGTAKITGAQFFSSYFTEELTKIVEKTLEEIDDIGRYTPDQIGDLIFSEENINLALEKTFFERMKDSGDWARSSENKGYQELFSIIERFNKSSFLSQVSQAYHLDELKQKLMEQLNTEDKMQKVLQGGKKKMKTTVKSSLKESTTAKGTLAEILGDQGVGAVFQKLKQEFPDIEVPYHKVVGSAGGKADIVLTFGLDFSQILPTIEQHYNNRTETVEAYKQLNNYLSNIKSGFVVYTNAKDYSLIQDKGDGSYSFQGFSAGSAISLENLEGVIKNTPGGSAEIIGMIMSTMKDAVYEDLKDTLEEQLCEKMAYFLFDDVLTIGKDTKAAGHAIHLLLLDGVYIPLSYLFFLMAQAIDEVNKDPDDIFKITITPGTIAFPEGPWEKGKWAEQKRIAYSQIKIGATFLKSFVQVVKEMRDS